MVFFDGELSFKEVRIKKRHWGEPVLKKLPFYKLNVSLYLKFVCENFVKLISSTNGQISLIVIRELEVNFKATSPSKAWLNFPQRFFERLDAAIVSNPAKRRSVPNLK